MTTWRTPSATTTSVDQREKEIKDLWDDLQRKAAERKRKLADAEQQQRFKEEARDLESWLGNVKKRCRDREALHDVAEAEELLKKHADLVSEIEAIRNKSGYSRSRSGYSRKRPEQS